MTSSRADASVGSSRDITTGLAGWFPIRRGRYRALRLRSDAVPLRWEWGAVLVLGAAGATMVGYFTAQNPSAGPPHAAVALRVGIVVCLIGAGVYALTSHMQERMGQLLLAAGLYSCVWLLNGSTKPGLFSLGVLSSGLAPAIFAYLMLAHPMGQIESRAQRWFVIGAGASMMLGWTVIYLLHAQPQIRTPLLHCIPHCPRNPLFVGSAPPELATVLRYAITVIWIAVACATPVLVALRGRAVTAPLRRSLGPVEAVAVASAVSLVGFVIARGAHSSLTETFGGIYVGLAAAIPLAILLGLSLERLFMGRTLAELVDRLGTLPASDPEASMSAVMGDPTLRIGYPRDTGALVDLSGSPIAEATFDNGRAVVWIERRRRPVAAVIYSAELRDQERYIRAGAAAAMMRLEAARLEADLRASTRELMASRVRLVEAADAERRRIERDLHDSVQQQLLGLRAKLDLAGDEIRQGSDGGGQMIATIGHQMDDLLNTVRSLARGIYPSLLAERGLGPALKSAARLCPVPVSVRTTGVGRLPEDVEVAIYFCCLEAIQNVVKHGGQGVSGHLQLRRNPESVSFELSDDGVGFEPAVEEAGRGLINMQDRIEAVGGALRVTSSTHHGTSVSGSVPIV